MSLDRLNQSEIPNPKLYADKSSKVNLSKAIQLALEYESDAVRGNTQTFNRERYIATAEMNDYQDLKEKARWIKEHSIQNISGLIDQLQDSIESRGGIFHLAADARDAAEYITKICREHSARIVVKAKSMTTEEIRLNHVLENADIEVVETDLGEMVIQLAGEHPSHLVGPAIHRSRERISALFKEIFQTDEPLETGEELTKFARNRLRQKFLSADVGISGANVIAADSGTLLLVESEGNIRMATQAPSVHIAIAGVEKVVPTRKDLIPFIELISPSGTGQPLTTYTNIISPPLDVPPFAFNGREKKEREFYMVLVDNGRMRMREDTELREALYCIRCGACLNSCANFQSLGGHAFGGETYSGGIGGAWEAGIRQLESANFNELCTGCSRCVPQCPVQIDIPKLNTVIRSRLNKTYQGSFPFVLKRLLPSESGDTQAPLQKQVFGNYHVLAKIGSQLSPVSNWIGNLGWSKRAMEKLFGFDRRRKLPGFPAKTLQKQYAEWMLERQSRNSTDFPDNNLPGNAVLFADTYTNHLNPHWGMATVKVFRHLGLNLRLTQTAPEGRAALSQGMIATARGRAKSTAKSLESYIDSGLDIIVIEPSVLALFRSDYENLLNNFSLFEKLKDHTYDPLEYLKKFVSDYTLSLPEYFDISRIRNESPNLFYHSHCQQRTSNAAQPTIDILTSLGFQLTSSGVECCGMAGSFGFKKEYYDVSMRVGEDLFNQITVAESNKLIQVLLASGTSCHDQIQDGIGRDVLHPMELLEKYIRISID